MAAARSEILGDNFTIDLTQSPARVIRHETPSHIKTKAVMVAAIAIMALNVADIVTTHVALQRGATEGNPFADLFVHHLPIFVAIKILFPAFVALRMYAVRKRVTPMLLSAMWWTVGVYSLAIVVNILHLVKGS